MKFAILGLGNRGEGYADILMDNKDKGELVAVCDVKEEKCRLAIEKFGVKEDMVFSNEKAFFEAGKLADILFVSTMDVDHYRHTMQALALGYDIILEKPISPKEEECREIIQTAEKLGRKIAICHVLRYTPFYAEIKARIEKGEIGDIMTLSATENVGYWHQAHSFVRGNWRNSDETSPMILQKCCHDMDIIRWLMDSPCVSISSFGDLTYFKKENKPEGATERCVDCPHKKECLYSAETYYVDKWTKETQGWPHNVISSDRPLTKESMIKGIQETPWGRCVYACDNNVVDHQITNMSFANGAIAQLNMVAFSKKNDRRIHIWGTKGEIIGDMEERWIDVHVFGKKEVEHIDLNQKAQNLFGHGGGDVRLIYSFVENYKNGGQILSSAKASLESHLMAFAAEKSRLNGGKVVKIEL